MAMATTTATGRSFTSDTALEIYTTGLRNAHALEQQATQLMERQIERYERYPEVTQMLKQHLRETEQQIARLEELMHGMGTDRSAMKDWVTSIMGNLAAIGHTIMPDEILKNTFANHAFENFEVASYTSLIAMAEATGNSGHVSALRQTLTEEQRMASWILENTPAISLKYLQLAEQGQKADR
jgi:ferritin-like metal-binding protein YciE